ncbi:MAG: hypothetical protein P8Y60_12800 [Calditrichota bacterium]|jgi:hypothetical protein
MGKRDKKKELRNKKKVKTGGFHPDGSSGGRKSWSGTQTRKFSLRRIFRKKRNK